MSIFSGSEAKADRDGHPNRDCNRYDDRNRDGERDRDR